MVTTDFIFNPRCSQGANKRSQNCEMYPKSQVVRHAMGLYTATEDMGRILAINWAKSKCWPEHFRLRTIGIECDLAIKWFCMFKDVKRNLSTNPTPAVGWPNVEPPHTQPTAIDKILRDATDAGNFIIDGWLALVFRRSVRSG
ncbi:hypothetical protein [Rhizobium leguminosarum]|uniref:hypothetical protein n=1 Tax=Rhizobium leguminosarum TaxID=384 RepID=UPI003D7C1601